MKFAPCYLTIFLLSGCTLIPEKASPDNSLPGHYPHSRSNHILRDDGPWWRSLGNAELNTLVDQAHTGSQDIVAAIARIQQGRAQVRIANAALIPQIGGSLGINRNGSLDELEDSATSSISPGLTVSYEADVWGKLRAGRRGAIAAFRADVYDRDAVALTVMTDTANAWLQAVAARERAVIAERNLSNARRLLDFIEARRRAGAATEMELAQQRSLVAAQESALVTVRTQIQDSQLALGILLGRPGAFRVRTASLSAITVPRQDAGIPSSLLSSRPDLARAEAMLVAADANIDVARASMLPSLNLSAGLNSSSPSVADVFNRPLYQLASNVAAPIFQGGRLSAERDLSFSRREELLAQYRKSIIAAFAEVESALIAQSGLEGRRDAQSRQLTEARRAFELAEVRYRAGAETLQSLLQTQTALYSAEDEQVQLRLARLLSSIALYKAIGGGWVKF